MKKDVKHKIGASATNFVNKYFPNLSEIRKAERVAMLKEFAISQVKRFNQ